MFIGLDSADLAVSERSVLEAVGSAFEGLAKGKTIQPRQTVLVFPGGAGDCIVYPGYIDPPGVFGVKVSPYLVRRADRGEPPVTAYTLLMSGESGEPVALINSLALTVERTAATSIVGLLQMSLPDRSDMKVAIVGSGAIGRAHARYASIVWETSTIALWSPNLHEGVRRNVVHEEVPRAEIAGSLDALLDGASVVMLCTSSTSPVIDIGNLPAETIVSSVSTNGENAHEIEWQALPSVDVYCDYLETCPDTAGEMRLAEGAGIWNRDSICGDLPLMLSSPGSAEFHEKVRFFRSTGLGLEDLAVAALLLPGN